MAEHSQAQPETKADQQLLNQTSRSELGFLEGSWRGAELCHGETGWPCDVLTLQGLAPSRDNTGRHPGQQDAGAAGQPQPCRARDRESPAGSSWQQRLNANGAKFQVK